MSPDSATGDWLRSEAGMRSRIREKDWSQTPLGERAKWPEWLRVTVRLVLDTPFPILMGVGDQLIAIYNEAYRPLLGTKDEPLGRPMLEIWSETRDTIEPLIGDVWEGRSHFFTEMPFTVRRYGEPEETWFDFSLSPLRDGSGRVAGLMNIALESTERVQARQELIESAEELNRRVQHRTADLKAEVKRRERLQREVRRAADAERQRLGHALNEGVAQDLTAARMMANSLQRRLNQDDSDEAERQLEQLVQVLEHADEHASRLVREITPIEIEEAGIEPALEQMQEDMGELHEVEIRLDVGSLPAMSAETMTHLFRIIQEAVLHAATRGEASRIEVTLQAEEDEVRFEVEDDQSGPSSPRSSRSGPGIRIMKHRAEVLGGRLAVEEAVGEGTSVSGAIPVGLGA